MDKTTDMIFPDKITWIRVTPEEPSNKWKWVPEKTTWWGKIVPGHWYDDNWPRKSQNPPGDSRYVIRVEGGVPVCMVKPNIQIKLSCGIYFTEYYDTMDEINDRISHLRNLAGVPFTVVK